MFTVTAPPLVGCVVWSKKKFRFSPPLAIIIIGIVTNNETMGDVVNIFAPQYKESRKNYTSSNHKQQPDSLLQKLPKVSVVTPNVAQTYIFLVMSTVKSNFRLKGMAILLVTENIMNYHHWTRMKKG